MPSGPEAAGVAAIIVDYGHTPRWATRCAACGAAAYGRCRRSSSPTIPAAPPGRWRRRPTPTALVLEPGTNTGFAGGCNAGAAAARADADVAPVPEPGRARSSRTRSARSLAVTAARPATGAVGAQVLLPDGRANAGHNPVHPSGLAWAGGLYEPAEDGPDRPALALSGAALLVRRDVFDALGGFCAPLLHVPRGRRAVLARRASPAGTCASARGPASATPTRSTTRPAKWRHLERNRAWLVLSAYERRTLLALAPLLAATELGDRRLGRARRLVAREGSPPTATSGTRGAWLRGRRAEVQRLRTRDDGAVLDLLAPRVVEPAPRRPGRAPRQPGAGRLPGRSCVRDAATRGDGGSRTPRARGPPARPGSAAAAAPAARARTRAAGTSTSQSGCRSGRPAAGTARSSSRP